MSTIDPASDQLNKAGLENIAFKAAVEKATAGVAITDMSGNILFINETYAGFYGYEVNDLLGKNVSNFYKAEDKTVTEARIKKIRETGVWEGELHGIRKDGMPVDVHLSAHTIVDTDGKTIALVGFTNDITERNANATALELYKQAFDSMSLGLALVDINRKITHVNPALSSITGYSDKELVGMDPYELQATDELVDLDDRVKKTREGLEKFGFYFEEINAKTKQGRFFPATLHICLLKDEQEKPLGFVGILEDVSENKKLREDLEQKYKEFQSLFENAYDAIFTYDTKGQFIAANAKTEIIMGYVESELQGMTIFDLVIPDEHETLKSRVGEIFSGKPLTPYEYRIKRKDGVIRCVEVGSSVINLGTGVDRILGVGRDVTESKQKERQLIEQSKTIEQAKQDWEIAFNAISDAIFIVDEDRVIIKANHAMYKMLEIRPEDIIGKKCSEVLCTEGGLLSQCPSKKMIPAHPIENLIISDTTLNKIFDFSVFPFKPAGSEGTHVLHTISDITEQSKLREALVQTEKLTSLGELVAGIAHEINNPLAAVSGYAQLLLGDVGDESVLDGLRKIEANANRAASIVRNLMQFSRKQDSTKRSCDVNEVVDSVVQMKYYSLFVADIKLESDLQADLPHIFADQIQLQQVLLNIIVNAEQAILSIRPFGKITIYTRMDSGFIKILVSDNGCGMTPGTINRMFDPFFTTKGVGVGTGLGLSAAYGIIKDHGGEISAESEVGVGSTITLSLPIQPAESKSMAVSPSSELGEIELSGKKILVIDDETILQNLIKAMLEKDGVEVVVAGNGIEAMEKLGVHNFDCVLADIKMPGLDGRGLFDVLASSYPQYIEKLAFITGDAVSPDISEFLKRSKRPHILKPFDLSELKDLVKRLLKQT